MYICYDVCVCVSHSKSVFTDADLLMTFANLCLRISGEGNSACSDGYVKTMTTTCDDWGSCDYSCCPGHSNPTITPTSISLSLSLSVCVSLSVSLPLSFSRSLSPLSSFCSLARSVSRFLACSLALFLSLHESSLSAAQAAVLLQKRPKIEAKET